MSVADPRQSRILQWCQAVLGPCTLVHEASRLHQRSSLVCLRTAAGQYCYAKIHREEVFWHREVHAYCHWASVFGDHAPRLLGVHAEAPRALMISQLPGRPMETAGGQLSVTEERNVWRTAGRWLARLHGLRSGGLFGTCLHDGSCPSTPCRDPAAYVSAELESWAQAAAATDLLDDVAQAAIALARESIPLFAGESPVACHRDYGPANWHVTDYGNWAGVLDFEMAHWDVAMADFARYPDWQWIHRPDLLEAMWEGYGRQPTRHEQRQLLCLRVIYALSAIAWGRAHSHLVFAQEGLQALTHLAKHNP